MMHTAPISTRNSFGTLLNDLGLIGKAVEVGTHRGDFAALLLLEWLGELLVCVDHWDVPQGYEAQAELLPEKGKNREEDFSAACERLRAFSDRVLVFRGTGSDAAARTPKNSLDFVYLDGDHSPSAFMIDVLEWWPKLRPGGVLACHDFLCPGEIDSPHNWGPGIQRVFLLHAERENLTAHLVVEEGGLPWSAYVIKPK